MDAPFDELLKDADVIDHSLTDPAKAVKEKEQARYDALTEELLRDLERGTDLCPGFEL